MAPVSCVVVGPAGGKLRTRSVELIPSQPIGFVESIRQAVCGLTPGAPGLPPACVRPPRLLIAGPASGMSAARLEKTRCGRWRSRRANWKPGHRAGPWSRNALPGSPIPPAKAAASSSRSMPMARAPPPTISTRLRRRGAAPSRVRRHSDLGQGPVRRCRRRHHVGLGGAARRAARGGRRGGGGAPARRRPDPDRPHQHDRVRVHRPRHQSALRHAAQSLTTAPPAGFPAARRRARRCR